MIVTILYNYIYNTSYKSCIACTEKCGKVLLYLANDRADLGFLTLVSQAGCGYCNTSAEFGGYKFGDLC